MRVYKFDRNTLQRWIGHEFDDLLKTGRRPYFLPIAKDIVDVSVKAPEDRSRSGQSDFRHRAPHLVLNSSVPGEESFAEFARAVKRCNPARRKLAGHRQLRIEIY